MQVINNEFVMQNRVLKKEHPILCNLLCVKYLHFTPTEE